MAGFVRAWTALSPSSVEGRFEALHASGLTDLVGRDAEANGRNNLANASLDQCERGAGGMASKIRRGSYDDRGGLLNSH